MPSFLQLNAAMHRERSGLRRCSIERDGRTNSTSHRPATRSFVSSQLASNRAANSHQSLAHKKKVQLSPAGLPKVEWVRGLSRTGAPQDRTVTDGWKWLRSHR